MHNDLVELGWSDEHWHRIALAIAEEAQKARVAAQMLPIAGPEHPSTVAVPGFVLHTPANPSVAPAGPQHLPSPMLQATQRLAVDSAPTLFLTTIAVNVYVRSHEAADPNLTAALGMFRRAGNYIARIEDALVFNGRSPHSAPSEGLRGIPNVYSISGEGSPHGLLLPRELERGAPQQRLAQRLPSASLEGDAIVTAIIAAIGQLEAAGQQGPYACALSQRLFEVICTPTPNLVLPRDRILPFLQGPLLRASTIQGASGVVVALSGSPVELVVASDIGLRFLQTTLEPRLVFRVSERVALRIREESAIAVLSGDDV